MRKEQNWVILKFRDLFGDVDDNNNNQILSH